MTKMQAKPNGDDSSAMNPPQPGAVQVIATNPPVLGSAVSGKANLKASFPAARASSLSEDNVEETNPPPLATASPVLGSPVHLSKSKLNDHDNVSFLRVWTSSVTIILCVRLKNEIVSVHSVLGLFRNTLPHCFYLPNNLFDYKEP